MSEIITKQNDNVLKYVVEGFLDKRTDIDSLSTDYSPGSTFCAIDDGSVWVLNSDKIWKELSSGGDE